MRPPLERYQDKIVEFIHELTPLVLPRHQQGVLRQFQSGHRKGLGMRVWTPLALSQSVALSGSIIAWKTLCFPQQLTGLYSSKQKKAERWLNAFQYFVSKCDPLISHQLLFGQSTPGITLVQDNFWRVRAFNPNESEFEEAKNLLTNVVYYDFDSIPEWLVRETQRSIKNVNHAVTFSIEIIERPKRYSSDTSEQQIERAPWKPSDDEADD